MMSDEGKIFIETLITEYDFMFIQVIYFILNRLSFI